jgi:hypothetical protein
MSSEFVGAITFALLGLALLGVVVSIVTWHRKRQRRDRDKGE